MWLLAVFMAVPVIEIGLFITIGGWLTLWPTLAIVVGTAILGTALVKQQGRKALNDLRMSINDVQDPSEPLAHGAMILFSGALLLTPGFLTDAIGFSLLIPQVREVAFRFLKRNVVVISFGAASTGPAGVRRTGPQDHGDVIEGDYRAADEDESATNGPSGRTRH